MSQIQLPPGMKAYPERGPGVVGVRLGRSIMALLWISVVLTAALAIGMTALVITSDNLGAAEGWGGAALFWAILAYVVVLLVRSQQPALLIDDTALRTNSLVANVEIALPAITSVTLSEPRQLQMWIDAPGGISRRGKVRTTKRLPITVNRYATHPADLRNYLVARVNEVNARR